MRIFPPDYVLSTIGAGVVIVFYIVVAVLALGALLCVGATTVVWFRIALRTKNNWRPASWWALFKNPGDFTIKATGEVIRWPSFGLFDFDEED